MSLLEDERQKWLAEQGGSVITALEQKSATAKSVTEAPKQARTDYKAQRDAILADPIRAYEQILSRQLKVNGKAEIKTLCPLHDDHNPSMRINQSKGTWYCDPCSRGGDVFTLAKAVWGCDFKDAAQRLAGGLGIAHSAKPTQPASPEPKPGEVKKEVSRHAYPNRGPDGTLAATHKIIRYSNAKKTVWWEDPEGGQGLRGLSTTELWLYGTERAAQWPDDSVVFLTEGESCAERLWEFGVKALGTVTGSGSIPGDEALKVLLRFIVVVWPDHASDGRVHMTRIGERLLARGLPAARLQWLEPTSVAGLEKEGADAADLDDDRLRAALESAVVRFGDRASFNQVPAVVGDTGNGKQPAQTRGLLTPRDFLARLDSRQLRPLWGMRMVAGTLAMIVGRAWSGKTTLAMSLAEALRLALNFMGESCAQCKVAYFAIERNGTKVIRVFDNWGLSDSILVQTAADLPIGFEARMKYLCEEIIKHGLEVAVIDHLQVLVGIQNQNDAAMVSAALERLNQIAQQTGCLIIVLHHQGKTPRFNSDFIDVLGSEAYRAHIDSLFECYKAFGSYFIRGQMRDESDMPRMRLFRDPITGKVSAADDQGEVGLDDLIVETLEAEPRWQSRRQIVEASPELAAVQPRILNRRLKLLSESDSARIQRRAGSRKTFQYAALGVVNDAAKKPEQEALL